MNYVLFVFYKQITRQSLGAWAQGSGNFAYAELLRELWSRKIQVSKTIIKWHLHDSIVVSIPACHAGDRGSIPRRGVLFATSEVNTESQNLFVLKKTSVLQTVAAVQHTLFLRMKLT